jgi:hypothetical protein
MSQAKRRGTYEQRVAQAQERERLRLQTIDEARRLRYLEEVRAWDTMVWWQIEMTERREYIRRKRMTEMQVTLAGIFGMIGGMSHGFRR